MAWLDYDGLLYFWQKIKAKLADKVDKVDGKGLSTNDFSVAYKAKLDGIANGANNYSHPTSSGNKHIPAGGSAGQILRWSSDGTAQWGNDNNTTYSAFKGATSSAAGGSGLVPAPAATNATQYLRGDGTWATPPDTKYNNASTSSAGLMSSGDKAKLDGIAANANNYAHPTSAGNKHIPAGGSAGQILRWSADGTAQWGNDNNTTYSDMKGATTEAAGVHGLAPAPAAGAANRYLRSDGTWQVPPDTNTTYGTFKAATASAAGGSGLVPAPAAGKQGQYLRGDGTWATPINTTYSDARLDVNKGAWVDKSITFLISQDFSGGGYGICRLVYRSNADSGSASVDAQWLVRRGFSADTIQVAIKTDKTNGAYCDAFYKSSGTYMGVVIRAIASGGRATSGRTWTLVDSNEVGGTTATDKKTSSECWKTIADAGTALHKQAYSASAPAKDEGYVASAGSANTSSSCAGNSASATKLTSSAGSATQPVYFKDGKPVAGTYTLGDASSKTVRTLGAVGNTGWANKTTDDKYIPTMSFMAYWNGAYSGTSSNLQYCDRGRFGTIVTKGSGDYAAAGHTHNYAGSGSAGGSANSAVKLDSNAGSSVQPVYFSGGKPVAIGYTISSSVPANAKFTDTTYGVASSSSNGLMSSTDKTKLDDFSRVISIQKQIKLTTDWLDTGIAGNSLDTGTYVVQVSGFNSSYTQLYSEIYSGVMSWYSGTTNSGNSSEIFLHNAGLADNNNAIYLRTLRVAGSKTLKLQIACKVAATGTDILTFKFRRLI